MRRLTPRTSHPTPRCASRVRPRRPRRHQDGQVLVEFALVLPLLILMFAVMVDLGDLMLHHAAVRSTLGETARLVLDAQSRHEGPLDVETIQAIQEHASRVTALAKLDPTDIRITFSPPSSRATTLLGGAPDSFREVVIQIDTDHGYIIPFLMDQTAGTEVHATLRLVLDTGAAPTAPGPATEDPATDDPLTEDPTSEDPTSEDPAPEVAPETAPGAAPEVAPVTAPKAAPGSDPAIGPAMGPALPEEDSP